MEKNTAYFSAQTTDDANNLRAQEPVSLNAASVKLPPFSRTDAQVWFRRAETHFRLKGVSRSSTMADHVLASIPDEIFSHIAHWLNEQPDQLSYETLKSYLLKEFTLKPAERAQRVLALATQPIGDMTAHCAWYEMQALLTQFVPLLWRHVLVALVKAIFRIAICLVWYCGVMQKTGRPFSITVLWKMRS